MSSRVLVTGAWGYIGGRVARHLDAHGYVVRLASRIRQSAPNWLPHAETSVLDLREDRGVDAACDGVNCIVHLAALNEHDCVADPEAALLVNGLGTLRLLRAAERQGVKRFIFFSTAHVYGSPLQGVIREDCLPRPAHPYAITHRIGEDYVLASHDRETLTGLVLRLSNGFGAPVHPDVNRWTLLINDLCRQAVSTFQLRLQSSGLQLRDFVTLGDAARATNHLLALPRHQCGGAIFNLGSESTMRIIDMAELVAARCEFVLGFRPTILRPDPGREEQYPDMTYCIDRIRSTGFVPENDVNGEIDATLRLCQASFWNPAMTVEHAQDAGAEPKVSVIMNCLNGEKYVRAAIESVYAQNYSNWEIIFLDNASTDGTAAIARDFDGRLRYFRNEHVVPLGEARNIALKQASGEFIAFLDSDDLWLPTKLARQIPLFKNRPELGLVFSDTELRYAGTDKRTTYFKSHHYKPPRGRIFSSLLLHYSIPMLTAVIRSRTLNAMEQWFDSGYRVCDDFDFFMRLAFDWDCDYLDESLAICLIHGEAVTAKMHRFGPGEMVQTIEKFRCAHPDFDQGYGNEVAVFLKQVAFKQGKSYWQAGDGRAARNEFGKHLLTAKFLLGYLATVFPYEAIARIDRAIRR